MLMVNELIGFGVGSSVVETSYANAGGTGDRTASITVSGLTIDEGTLNNLVDGNFADGAGGSVSPDAGTTAFKFDFGSNKVIDEFKLYGNTTQSTGWTVQWAGSTDDASYSDIGSPELLTITTAGTTHAALAGNQTAYRYYRATSSSGNPNSGHYWREFEFKIF